MIAQPVLHSIIIGAFCDAGGGFDSLWAEVCRAKEGRELKARMRRLIEDSNKGFFGDEKGDAKNDGYKVKDIEKVGLFHYYLKAGKFEVE